MSRRVARLTLDTLADLPSDVRSCVFWELDPVRREQVVASGDAPGEKEAWLSTILLEWGSCGRVLYVDDVAVGHALYAPPAFLPGAASLPTSPASDDAVLLASVCVVPDLAGGGLGRVLMQAVVKDLVRRGGIRALEAFGDSRSLGPRAARGHAPCVLPADYLAHVGFKTVRPHPRYPRMRLDLRTAVTWRGEVEAALERLLGAVRPTPRPAPTPTPRQP